MQHHTDEAAAALHRLQLCSCYRYLKPHYRPNPPLETVQATLDVFGFVLVESTQAPGPLHKHRRAGHYFSYDPARMLWAAHPLPMADLNSVLIASYACHQLAGPTTYEDAMDVLSALGFTLQQTTWGVVGQIVWRLEHPESGFRNESFAYLKDVLRLARSHLESLRYQAAYQHRLVALLEASKPDPAAPQRPRTRSAPSRQADVDVDDDVQRARARQPRPASDASTQLPLFDQDDL